VKNCTAPMLEKPESARIACDTESPNVAPSRMRLSIVIWKKSTVNVTLSRGVNANPPLRLTDVSSLKRLRAENLGRAIVDREVADLNELPPITFVVVWLKKLCASPGARNPVLAAPRTTKRGVG